jgi:hypothetical protein
VGLNPDFTFGVVETVGTDGIKSARASKDATPWLEWVPGGQQLHL